MPRKIQHPSRELRSREGLNQINQQIKQPDSTQSASQINGLDELEYRRKLAAEFAAACDEVVMTLPAEPS
jgi:hypothetical protein